MTVRLIRYEDTGTETFGVLVLPQGTLHTIERPWRDNQPFKSAIPPGTYTLRPWESPSKGTCLKIDGCEPARTHCLFHPANVAEELAGCVAPGWRRGLLGPEPAVLQSRDAMRWLLQRITEPIELRILRLV